MLKLEQILEGAIGKRGLFTGYYTNSKGEVKKDAKEQQQQINWDEHFAGLKTYGLSPVKIIQNENGSKGLCRWMGWDIDLEIRAHIFCEKIFKLNAELFPYRSSGGRWHLHYYFDDFIGVDEARKKALEIEKKLLKIFGGGLNKPGVDTGHTVPSKYTIDKNKPGYWLFMPYSKNKELKNSSLDCYSPAGNQLTKSQTEFRYKWRKQLLVACSVGTTSGQGGREPFLFKIAQEIKWNKLDLTLDEVNENFNEPEDPRAMEKHKRSIEKSLADEQEHTKESYIKKYEVYLKDINGYYRKKLNGTGVLDGLVSEEDEEKQTQFYKDVIFIKLDERWYDKATGGEYKQTAIKVTYGSYFDGDVIKNFSKNPDAQLVEKTIYRPDLWENNDEPIVIDEDKLKQLNNYRPGGVEAMAPDTPQLKKELQMFKELVEKLTKHEGTGITDDGKEIKLYDYVLDHLSMPFQRRGEKVRSAIIFHSEKFQLGKSTLIKIVRKGLGNDNCTIIRPENATARERGFIENQLVLIDEIKTDGTIDEKKSVMNILKPLMTEELHDCRPLFKEWRQVYSTMNMILATNHKDAMALDPDEKRYTCIDIPYTRQELGGDKFYKPLYDAFKFGTLANVVKHFLSTREISKNFIPENPSLKTNFLEEMSKAGGHPILPEVEIIFKAKEEPFHQSILVFGEAWDYLKKEKGVRAKSSDFKKVLDQLGCERIGECKHKRSRKNLTIYILKNHKFFYDKTKSDMINKYWFPIGTEKTGSKKYNLSSGDVIELDKYQDEITGYEELNNEEDQDQDLTYEEIKKKNEAKK